MTPTQPRLRPATDADGPAIGALIAAIFAEYEGVAFQPEEFPELAAAATHFAARGGRMWVVEAEGAIVGCGAVAALGESGTFSLHKFYVAASLRGRGVAARLLAEALGFARAAGGTAVLLFTDTRFARGHAFYEKHGFRRLPGVRNLNDASRSLEYFYRREMRHSPSPRSSRGEGRGVGRRDESRSGPVDAVASEVPLPRRPSPLPSPRKMRGEGGSPRSRTSPGVSP